MLAWQLFSKQVISQAVVEDICFPVIPPNQKKNRLLIAVGDHIAVNPAGIYTFLQVLKMEPYLLHVVQSLEETLNGELSQKVSVFIHHPHL